MSRSAIVAPAKFRKGIGPGANIHAPLQGNGPERCASAGVQADAIADFGSLPALRLTRFCNLAQMWRPIRIATACNRNRIGETIKTLREQQWLNHRMGLDRR